MPDQVETRTADPTLDTVSLGASAAPTPPGGSWRGTSLGRFLVLDVVGAGGMGVVLAAYDPRLDRRVALKLLRPGRRSGETDETARLRLQREAQVMARLAHPNVVTVYDVGEVDDRVYVAMEFVEGRTLRQWLAERPRSWREIVHMFLGAGRGLAAAHAAGVVHRDFKPDNVLVGADERARVTDFGLASTSSRELPTPLDPAQPGTQLEAADLRRPLTLEGALVGTPAYMAPEQHDGAAVDAQADQFAFCVALYEALYGERPFKSEGYVGLLVQVKEGLVRSPVRGTTVPAWLRKVVLRGLRPRPEDRYPGIEALLRMLARDPSALRRRLSGGAIGVIAIGAVVVPFIHPRSSPPAPCSQARERLAGVWDDGIRQRVQRAFVAAIPGRGGQAAYQRVVARIDAYADGWVEMHTDACLATHQRREQSEKLLDARMACLERRRGTLGALTEALATADRGAAEKAVEASSALGSLRDCADAESLLAVVPPPPDLAAAQRVEDVNRGLDRVDAALVLGRVKQSAGPLAALVREADATGYAPLRARAHWLLAEHHHFFHDTEATERELMLMSRFHADGRDDKGLVRALNRMSLVYQMSNRPEHALATARAAELAARRLGDEGAVGNAQLTAAAALRDLARHAEADALFSVAFATLERRLVGDNQRPYITPLIHMASSAYMQGRFGEAHRLFERAHVLATATYGADHRGTLQAARLMAAALHTGGRLPEARQTVADALRMALEIEPRDEMLANNLEIDLALLEERMGERAAAARRLEQALTTAARMGHRAAEARARLYLARIRIAEGHWEEARALLVRARDLDSTPTMTVSIQTAEVMLAERQRRLGQARAALASTIGLCEKAAGASDFTCGNLHVVRARLEAGTGNCRAARPHLDRGEQVVEKAMGPDHPMMADSLTVRGRCLLAERRPAEAIAPLERALAVLHKAGVGAHRRGEPRWLLARALWESGSDRGRAIEAAEHAERELATGDVGRADDLRALRAWRRTHRLAESQTETAKTPRN